MLKIKSIKPMFTAIVTTADKFTEDMYTDGGIIDTGCEKGHLKAYQTVIAVGDSVRGIQPGDKVMLNLANYAVRKYDPNSVKNDMDMNKVISYDFTWIPLTDEDGNTQDCLLLNDRDVLFSFEGEEVQGKKPEKSNLILPEKKKIITS